MTTVKIEMNFVEDVRARYATELGALGYKLPPSSGDAHKDAHCMCVNYWNATNRRIPVRPRQVRWSKELRTCEPMLAPEARSALAAIEQESRDGEDLNRRYSKSLKKLQYNDLMHHDWGIHHLHLGLVVGKDGFFVERTSDLLFVLVRDDDLYLVDVRPHGAWTDEDLVHIIHTNWPHAIAQFQLRGSRGLLSRRSSARICVTGTRPQEFKRTTGRSTQGLVVASSDPDPTFAQSCGPT